MAGTDHDHERDHHARRDRHERHDDGAGPGADLDAPPGSRPVADPIGAQAYEAADMQGALQRSLLPAAVAVRYDGETDRVTVILDTGVELAFAPRLVQGLGGAEIGDLSEAEISPSGHGLHFPRLNADVYLPGLLEGVMGTRRWMAAMARATPLRVVPRDAPWEIRRP